MRMPLTSIYRKTRKNGTVEISAFCYNPISRKDGEVIRQRCMCGSRIKRKLPVSDIEGYFTERGGDHPYYESADTEVIFQGLQKLSELSRDVIHSHMMQ